MSTYNVKTTYPTNENSKKNKTQLTKQTDVFTKIDSNEVLDLYSNYLQAGYKVSYSFDTNDSDSEQVDFDPFEVAKSLTKSDIEYKATLKLKAKGSYQDLKEIMHLIEISGYNMTVNVKLKINEKTSLNIDDPSSWTDEDAVFSITPSASSKNILELKELYDDLSARNFEVVIAIKPKKAADDAEEDETFEAALAQYPDNTTVKFNLTDSQTS